MRKINSARLHLKERKCMHSTPSSEYYQDKSTYANKHYMPFLLIRENDLINTTGEEKLSLDTVHRYFYLIICVKMLLSYGRSTHKTSHNKNNHLSYINIKTATLSN